MKYQALNPERFRYQFRAFVCANASIITGVMIEALTLRYVLVHAEALAIVNNFIKMKIIASFGNFFVEPFRQSSMSSYIGQKLTLNRHRKAKEVYK